LTKARGEKGRKTGFGRLSEMDTSPRGEDMVHAGKGNRTASLEVRVLSTGMKGMGHGGGKGGGGAPGTPKAFDKAT